MTDSRDPDVEKVELVLAGLILTVIGTACTFQILKDFGIFAGG